MATRSVNEFIWLIKREFWEHRSFIIVPAVILGIMLVTDVVAMIQGVQHIGLSGDAIKHLDQFEQGMLPRAGEIVFAAVGAIFMLATGIVATFYLLDCLYQERRDRSVLFWKSLPISDSATVFSKLVTAVLLLPLIAMVAALIAYVALLLIATVVLAFGGSFPLASLWNPVHWLTGAARVTSLHYVLNFWNLPVLAWFLFCSAFAKKAPFLWAILVPGGIILAENLAFGQSMLANIVGDYFMGLGDHLERSYTNVGSVNLDFSSGDMSVDGEAPSIAKMFGIFLDLRLYAGAAVASAFIAASIWWRRNRIEHG